LKNRYDPFFLRLTARIRLRRTPAIACSRRQPLAVVIRLSSAILQQELNMEIRIE